MEKHKHEGDDVVDLDLLGEADRREDDGAAAVPATMPAKKPQPLNRHQCHFNTLGATKAGTKAEVSHLVTPWIESGRETDADARQDHQRRPQVAQDARASAGGAGGLM